MLTGRPPSYVLLAGLHLLAFLACTEGTDKPSTPARRGPISVQAAMRVLKERRKQQYLLKTASMSTTFQVSQDPTTATTRTVTGTEPRDNPELNEIGIVDLMSKMTSLENPRETQKAVMNNMSSPLPEPLASKHNNSEVALLKQPETTISEKSEIPFQNNSDSKDKSVASGSGSHLNVTYFSQDLLGNLTGYHQLEENITVDEVDILTELNVNNAINSNVSLVGYYSNISNIGEHFIDMINSSLTSVVDRFVDSFQNASVFNVSEEISDMTSDDTDGNNLTTSYQYELSHSNNYSSAYTDGSKSDILFTEAQNSTVSNSTHAVEFLLMGQISTTARKTESQTTVVSTEQTTSRPKQTTSGYMYRTTEFDPLTNRGGPFLRKPNAYDFLMMGQIATAQRNEKQREFRESNYEASAQICALLSKRFCRLSIGGRCC